MPPAEFEPVVPASERPQAYALDRTATGIGRSGTWCSEILIKTRRYFSPAFKRWKSFADCWA